MNDKFHEMTFALQLCAMVGQKPSEDRTDDDRFMLDLVDGVSILTSVPQVLFRDGHINPGYAIEKIKSAQSYFNSVLSFYESKLEEK